MLVVVRHVSLKSKFQLLHVSEFFELGAMPDLAVPLKAAG